MLVRFEHQAPVAGGSYAFCDTDSLAIVATRRGPGFFGSGLQTRGSRCSLTSVGM